jgi:hypothetical protein
MARHDWVRLGTAGKNCQGANALASFSWERGIVILKSKESVRRLFAAHDLTIHSLRHGKHWIVHASRNGGPIQRVIISRATAAHVLRKIEADLRRVR